MTDLKQTAERISTERLEEMLAGLEGVTPGPWQVIEEKHEWSLPERSMMDHNIPAQSGEHLERRIFTTWEHPQAKSPWPVVNSSIGIGKAGEPSVQMVWIDPADAAHIARCDPGTMRSILTELLASRHADPQPEPAEWQVELVADAIDSVELFSRFNNWTSDRVPERPIEICRHTDDGDIEVVARFGGNITEAEALRKVISAERAKAALRAASLPAPERSKEETGVRGLPVTLAECPIGLFYAGSELCLKTEYGDNNGRIDAYIVSSGEFFWGGTNTPQEQRRVMVTPLSALETPPLHKEGEAGYRHQCASSGFHDHDGCSCSEVELRARFAVPVPVTITVDEVERIILETEPAQVSDKSDKIWTRRMATALAARLSALSVNPQSGNDKP